VGQEERARDGWARMIYAMAPHGGRGGPSRHLEDSTKTPLRSRPGRPADTTTTPQGTLPKGMGALSLFLQKAQNMGRKRSASGFNRFAERLSGTVTEWAGGTMAFSMALLLIVGWV